MRRTITAACIAASVLLWGTGVDAGKPEFERISVNDSGVDAFFSNLCGFQVIATNVGHITVRTSSDRTVGAVAVVTLNVQTTLSANGNEYTFRNVGADVLRITPEGELILSIIGQSPPTSDIVRSAFSFTGVLKINLSTDEVVEPQHSTEGDLNDVCATLAV